MHQGQPAERRAVVNLFRPWISRSIKGFITVIRADSALDWGSPHTANLNLKFEKL